MKLVDFLILLLEAHAQTLQRLAALIGEERLIGVLETAGENETQLPKPKLEPEWLSPPQLGESSAYAALDGAVQEFGLAPMLEFHLWAYPHYRAFVESSLDLSSRITTGQGWGPNNEAGLALVDEAVSQAQAWVQSLPLPAAIAVQAERAAHVPWLRFRSTVLKRIGKRPLGPVY